MSFPAAVTGLEMSSFRDYISYAITLQPRLSIFEPHFDHVRYISIFIHLPPYLIVSFMVLCFSLLLEKRFIQVICRRLARNRFVFTLVVVCFLKKMT